MVPRGGAAPPPSSGTAGPATPRRQDRLSRRSRHEGNARRSTGGPTPRTDGPITWGATCPPSRHVRVVPRASKTCANRPFFLGDPQEKAPERPEQMSRISRCRPRLRAFKPRPEFVMISAPSHPCAAACARKRSACRARSSVFVRATRRGRHNRRVVPGARPPGRSDPPHCGAGDRRLSTSAAQRSARLHATAAASPPEHPGNAPPQMLIYVPPTSHNGEMIKFCQILGHYCVLLRTPRCGGSVPQRAPRRTGRMNPCVRRFAAPAPLSGSTGRVSRLSLAVACGVGV